MGRTYLPKYRSKSRDRSSTQVLPNTEDRSYPGDALLAAYGGGTFATRTHTESIRYTVKPKNDRSTSNYCRQLKVEQNFPYSPLVYLRHTIASPTIKTYDNATTMSNEMTGSAVGQAACKTAFGVTYQDGVLGASAQSFMDQYFASMRPDLTEVSLPNFVIDFAQIGQLYTFWTQRAAKGLGSTARLQKLSRAAKKAADANLMLQYGWLPSVSDVGHMVTGILNLQQKIHDWNTSIGTVVHRRAIALNDTISKTGSSAVSTWGTVNWEGKLTRQCHVLIKYMPMPIQALNDIDLVLRGNLEALGVELNPAIIWDAIPFSFVVDWFLNVGSFLNRYRLDTLELPFRLLDSCVQYKEEMVIDCRTTNNGVAGDIPVNRYAGSRRVEKFFHRVPCGPSYSILSGAGWKLPSWRQGGMAASLAIQLL